MSDVDKKNSNAEAPENAEVNPESKEEQVKSEANAALENLQQELEKSKKDYLYLFAEFDNYKKQAIKERSQTIKYANENLLREILSVMDNFNIALQNQANADNVDSFVEGVKMIAKELQNTVERFGVIQIQSTGEKFDPTLHEALSSEPSESVPSGHILKVFKEGYKYHDRLLRPAQVIVATEPKKSEANQE